MLSFEKLISWASISGKRRP